ncbi:hypothetical protein TNCV_1118931 [Trichonephila clavipes]|uniref:Uncharacterized protein n=1 Tax=Trichonephila clavipes TaxID=2585209 RepID=A0A8X6VNT4_TRICX|nr:hypothetical protein TNCV_1118931 [Trichonephila clavipes]
MEPTFLEISMKLLKVGGSQNLLVRSLQKGSLRLFLLVELTVVRYTFRALVIEILDVLELMEIWCGNSESDLRCCPRHLTHSSELRENRRYSVIPRLSCSLLDFSICTVLSLAPRLLGSQSTFLLVNSRTPREFHAESSFVTRERPLYGFLWSFFSLLFNTWLSPGPALRVFFHLSAPQSTGSFAVHHEGSPLQTRCRLRRVGKRKAHSNRRPFQPSDSKWGRGNRGQNS